MNPDFEKTKKTKFMLVWRTIAFSVLLIISCLLLFHLIKNRDYTWDTILITVIFLVALFSMFINVFFLNAQKMRVFFCRKNTLLLKIAEENNFMMIQRPKQLFVIINHYLVTNVCQKDHPIIKEFLKNNFSIVEINQLKKHTMVEKINQFYQEKLDPINLDFLLKIKDE